MSFNKTVFCAILIFFNAFIISGEIKYRISGKILKKGQEISNLKVSIRKDLSPKELLNRESRITSFSAITNNNGYFFTYVPRGIYKIYIDNLNEPGFISIGPDGYETPYKIIVASKNIHITFEFISEIEFIEANLDILKEIPQNISTIIYKWGKIPFYSINDCLQYAKRELEKYKKECNNELAKEAVTGSPITFYDLEDRPVYYQFPIKIKGVEVAFLGVHAVGLSPFGDTRVELFPETESDLLKCIEYSKNKKTTWDSYIPAAIEVITEKKHCNKDNIHFNKMICLDITSLNKYIMFRIIPSDEIVIISIPYLDDILTAENTIEELKEYTSNENILSYLKSLLRIKHLPFIRKKL